MGDLRADPDAGRVSAVEDFYRKRFIYQLTRVGEAAEEALATCDEAPTIAQTLITHRFPLDEAAEAFRTAGDRASGAIMVVLHP